MARQLLLTIPPALDVPGHAVGMSLFTGRRHAAGTQSSYRVRMAREFACRCGETLQGDDDEALFTAVRAHADQKHPEMGMTDERIRQGIEMMAKDV